MVRALVLLALVLPLPSQASPDPALRLHGHNDYLQPVPLQAALDLGLGSVEADVFLADGELRVGHERWQLRPGRTLASLYLDPLQAWAAAHAGRVRGDGVPFVLLVDIKADGAAVYGQLRNDLAALPNGFLTRFVEGRIEPGAVTVILSGDRPRALVAADRDRRCALDGRLADLRAEPTPPRDLVPWVSDQWSKVSDWDGKDEFAADECARLADLVETAHAQGRELRFWGAPDREAAWRALLDCGVDRIGTDRPKVAAAFVRASRALQVDVCVYGATSAGVIAALQAHAQGQSVVLVDCDDWIGGLTTSGLGATDVGNKDAIGGLARTFYRRLRTHYDRSEAWTRQRREDFRGRGHEPGDDAAWTFEPSVAQATFAAMLAEAGIAPLRARLDRGADGASRDGVQKDGPQLLALRCEDGTTIAARVFVDCTYEGDLLAAAGCTFVVGREANARYGETLDGVQTANATKHQFTARVDPFVVPGDAASGLLPGVHAGGPGDEGAADARVQAYCYRICATDDPDNRVPWSRPDGYDARDYELLLRHFAAGSALAPWHPVAMPNRKTDSNNNGAFSFDWIGHADAWPTANYVERARLAAAHRHYQQGLLWTLANDPRVPAKVQAEFRRFGLARDEFAATDHWPPQLYVREGRRLVGAVVVTEHHCTGREVAADPVGMGAYGMDSHNTQRYVAADGSVRNEGDVQVKVPQPYGIPFGALQPRREEATNLLVPVCLSASHIAYGSVRMEPVFMVLAQSAAIAAGLALERGVAVQDVDYAALRERLLAAGQVLVWAPRGR